MSAPFFIKPGYVENDDPEAFDDTPEYACSSQQAVYDRAEMVAVLRGCDTFIDLGCGSAFKLEAIAARHPEWRVVGVDLGPNVDLARARAGIKVYADDLDDDDCDWPIEADTGRALLLCADVVEHLRDPRTLLRRVAQTRHVAVVLSTPERDLEHGVEHSGPPVNPAHVREWNRWEFDSLVRSCGLVIETVEIVPGSASDATPRTQCLVLR